MLLAAGAGAAILVVNSIASLLASPWTDISVGHVFEVATAIVGAGFLYLVRAWIAKQEEADRKLMDTIREHVAQQGLFEHEVYEFMGMVRGHFGLHHPDSDPGVSKGERRVADRRKDGR